MKLPFLILPPVTKPGIPLFTQLNAWQVKCLFPLPWVAVCASCRIFAICLNAGADKVAINSAAIHNPEFVREAAQRFGSQCIVVAIDAKQVEQGDNPRWEIFTHGGRKPTGINAIEWAKK